MGRRTDRGRPHLELAYVVGLAGLPHIIAGSLEVLYTVSTGEASWGTYLGGYMLSTFIGNTAGGVALVAWLNTHKWQMIHDRIISATQCAARVP